MTRECDTQTSPVARSSQVKSRNMSGKEKFCINGHSSTASQKRMAQLKSWENSATNKQPSSVNASRNTPTVKFGPTVVFMAAAHSGDIEEVERLVANNGADVNSVNKDGLTALHQCCIDDDFDMVKTLIRLGANVDRQDKEGWTPLHAASSCGHAHIVGFLLDHGAFPALVNNEGDTPLDLGDDYEEIMDALQERVDRDMIDMEAVRGVEEAMMLADANMLRNDHTLKPVLSHAGATPLHVAAAKNYLQVIKILLTLKASQVQLDAEDDDGWTALHAAVYWGNFLAAEELVAHGAELDKKTKAGDTIEDLCEPELEHDLNTLKKYRDQNNRKRSNAISQSNPRQLMHSNSREDITGGKQHSSPLIVRRRLGSSKDRSMFPKMDIAKEREEREIFVAETEDLSSPSVSSSTGRQVDDVNSLSPKSSALKINQNAIGSPHSPSEAREVAQDKDNSTKDAKGCDKTMATLTKSLSEGEPQCSRPSLQPLDTDITSSSDHNPADTTQGSPTHALKQGSPKSAKKKFTGMSPKMMMRVGQWEFQTGAVTPPQSSSSTASTASTASTTSSSSSSSRPFSSPGRGGPLPLASSTPTTTASPFSTANGEGTRFPETKRYSFQAKPVPSISSPSLSSRSVSVSTDQRLKANLLPYNRRSSHDIRVSPIAGHCKRSSLDDANTKSILGISPPDQEGYRASSLPRGAKIASSGNTSVADATATSTPKEKPVPEKKPPVADTKSEESEASAVATEASATPGSQTDGSLLNTTKDTSREMSVESNSSRGAPDDSETSRKMRARKTRQVRKQTQPVPSDVMNQISKHKELELSVPYSSSPNALASDTDLDGPSDYTNASTEDDSSAEQQKSSTSQTSRKHSEKAADAGGVNTGTAKEDVGGKTATMSTHKSSARPSSRVLNASKLAQQLCTQSSTASGCSSSTAVPSTASNSSALSCLNSSSGVSSGKVKSVDAVELKAKHEVTTAAGVMKSEGSSSSTSSPVPCPSRSKHADALPTTPSTHLSRSSEETSKNESIGFSPHNLHARTKSTARRKPREKRRSTGIVSEAADGEELVNLVRKSGDGATTTKASPDQTSEGSAAEDSPSSSRIGDDDEMSRLRSLLDDEQFKNRKIENEVEEMREKMMELNRRFQDATRAYEQEKRENELKDARISELQSGYKSLQDLRHENQRMKDENSALIRVIGKLSRSPLPHHTHT